MADGKDLFENERLIVGTKFCKFTEKMLHNLLSLADKALYQAKALGRNRYAEFQVSDKEVS